MIKFFIVLALFAVLVSLFSALYFLIRDQGRGERVVNALLIRITISVLLIGVILVLVSLGVIQPNPRPY